MLLKIGLTVLVIGLVWFFMIRQSGRGSDAGPRRLPRVETLGRCPTCGVYRIQGVPCDCEGEDSDGPR